MSEGMIANPVSEWGYRRNVFCAALAASLLLMASGLFIGALGIDDEFNALNPDFDGTGRGLWAQHLITMLLPGQLGITFAPALLGCILYAISIAIVIDLWGDIRKEVAYVSAALMGGFPYFASMMTFDAVQVAYPVGFILIAASLIPIFQSRRPVALGPAIVAFAVAFACYQGVAASFAAGWASIVGMRYLQADDRQRYVVSVIRGVVPKTLAVGVLGSLFYLLTVKISQLIIPHAEWSENYQVKASFSLAEPGRLAAIFENSRSLLLGLSGDLPTLAPIVLLVGIGAVGLGLLLDRRLALPLRPVVLAVFLACVFVLPFWILFAQSMPLAPRSAVGLGILYGYVFALLAARARRRSLMVLMGLAAIVLVQFIFVGNQMYYSQFLATQADQVTVTRIATRIDAVAAQHQLKTPVPVTFVGRYAPAGRQFAKYDTIGSSSLDWDNGSIDRQASLLSVFGVDGIAINRDPSLREEVGFYVMTENIPAWPAPGSVFLYKDFLVVVNLGRGT
jgi:hypothetical protein